MLALTVPPDLKLRQGTPNAVSGPGVQSQVEGEWQKHRGVTDVYSPGNTNKTSKVTALSRPFECVKHLNV